MNDKPAKKTTLLAIFTASPITAPLLVALVLVLLSLSGYILQTNLDSTNIYTLITVVQLIVFLFPCILYYFIKGRRLASPLMIAGIKPTHTLFLLSGFLLLLTGTILIKFFFYSSLGQAPTEINYFSLDSSTAAEGSSIQIFIAFVLVPAVCEELFLRGVVLAEYRALGTFNAVLFSSICFAMLHFSFQSLPLYLFSGIVLGATAIVCESVVAPMILHVLSNFFSVYTSDLFLRVTIQKCGSFFVGFILIAAFLISIIFVSSQAERIFYARAENPPETIPPRSREHFVSVFLSPAFFLLVFVFVLLTILM